MFENESYGIILINNDDSTAIHSTNALNIFFSLVDFFYIWVRMNLPIKCDKQPVGEYTAIIYKQYQNEKANVDQNI